MQSFDESQDYYAVLDLTSQATDDEIVKAYKTLVSKYHPDKHQGNELENLAKEKLEQLNEAYRVIGDTKTRVQYDSLRRTQNSREQYRSSCHCAPSAPPPQSGAMAAKIFRWLILALILYISLRVVRSPRAFLIVSTLIGAIIFGPKIIKKIKPKK